MGSPGSLPIRKQTATAPANKWSRRFMTRATVLLAAKFSMPAATLPRIAPCHLDRESRCQTRKTENLSPCRSMTAVHSLLESPLIWLAARLTRSACTRPNGYVCCKCGGKSVRRSFVAKHSETAVFRASIPGTRLPCASCSTMSAIGGNSGHAGVAPEWPNLSSRPEEFCSGLRPGADMDFVRAI